MLRWNAPEVDPELGVGYDLDDLEGQPEVKAGDWLTLNNGDRVVLCRLPIEHVSTDLRIVFNGPQPELLFFKHAGKWHIGAINGRSLVGVAPVVNSQRAALEHMLRRSGLI